MLKKLEIFKEELLNII